MKLLLRKNVYQRKVLDRELLNTFNKYRERDPKAYEPIFCDDFVPADKEMVVSTLVSLIQLLSRKREKNALHMHMIQSLSEEVNKIILDAHSFDKRNDELNPKYYAIEAELLLKDCYTIMELAEERTIDWDIEEMYIFKDEKKLLRDFFADLKINHLNKHISIRKGL